MFSACLRQSISTSKLLFLLFLTVFGRALVEIAFSIRKGENLAKPTSSKDSITMNLGKSAASFSESDCEKFRLDLFYLKTPYMLYIFRWPCALLPTTESQFMLGTNQEGNPFVLVETGIDDQYIRVEGSLLSRC